MEFVIQAVPHALLEAAGMAWQVGWSLVLGFMISGLLQVLVSREAMTRALGRGGPKQVAIAAAAGAASSSCSYAAAAITRTLFARGAAFGPSLAFLVASTNLVAELGLILLLLMGWQFMVGEWLGGLVMVVIVALLVRFAVPAGLIDAARDIARGAESGHDHGASQMAHGSLAARLTRRETWVGASHAFAMDWSMLWKDLVAGFLIAGALAAFVPHGVWQTLFLHNATPTVRVLGNALLGPLVAVLSFVCSIGNVPMAAVLWRSGVSFGGVLAFLLADLIVLPLLDIYRRQFGWRMAVAMTAMLYIAMVGAALVLALAFHLVGWVPPMPHQGAMAVAHFSLNYTFWLNLAAVAAAGWMFWLHRQNEAPASTCPHHGRAHHHPT